MTKIKYNLKNNIEVNELYYMAYNYKRKTIQRTHIGRDWDRGTEETRALT